MLDARQQNAIVRVETRDGQYKGTAFFISPRAAVTCYHVIRDVPRESIRLRGSRPGGVPVSVIDVRSDIAMDVAVIEVDEPDWALDTLSISPPGWPARGDELVLWGYTSTVGGIEGRPFMVAGYESNMFHVQGLAKQGISGGPAVNRAGLVVGIGRLINDRNLTFFVPIARILNFLQSIQSTGLIAAPKRLQFRWNDDRQQRGLSSSPGSVHIHIDGGRGRKIAVEAARVVDLGQNQSEVSTILEFIDGPQRTRATHSDLYADHTPGENAKEELEYFTTTLVHSGPEPPNPTDIPEIQDRVRAVLGYLTTRARNDAQALAGGIVVEVERVVGVIAEETQRWVANSSLNTLFGSEFLFSRRGAGGENTYEIHLSVDLDRCPEDERPPLELNAMLDLCRRAGIDVGGWFLFDKPNRWAYRSNMFLDNINQTGAAELHCRLTSELDRLEGVDLSGRVVRVIVEESLGVWKSPFPKRRGSADLLTVPELAIWERDRPAYSKFWVVSGDFLGDRNEAVQNAMIENIKTGVTYVYFLRSFADLRRWVHFRRTLEEKVQHRLEDQMVAYLLEFEDDSNWAKQLDCFISFPRQGPPEGYKLIREGRSNRIIMGAPLTIEQIQEARNLIERPMDNREVIASRRLVEEKSFSGAVVWLNFGLFTRFAEGLLSNDKLTRFVEDFDAALALHVSSYSGEVIRSNEAGFVVLIPRNDLSEAEIAARALGIARSMIVTYRALKPAEVDVPTYRLVAEYVPEMHRVIRSNGQAVESPGLHECRMRAAVAAAGTGIVLRRLKMMVEDAQPQLGVAARIDGEGNILIS